MQTANSHWNAALALTTLSKKQGSRHQVFWLMHCFWKRGGRSHQEGEVVASPSHLFPFSLHASLRHASTLPTEAEVPQAGAGRVSTCVLQLSPLLHPPGQPTLCWSLRQGSINLPPPTPRDSTISKNIES